MRTLNSLLIIASILFTTSLHGREKKQIKTGLATSSMTLNTDTDRAVVILASGLVETGTIRFSLIR